MFTCLRCRNPFNENLGNCPICGKAFPHPVAEIIPDAILEDNPEIEAEAPLKLPPKRSHKKK